MIIKTYFFDFHKTVYLPLDGIYEQPWLLNIVMAYENKPVYKVFVNKQSNIANGTKGKGLRSSKTAYFY